MNETVICGKVFQCDVCGGHMLEEGSPRSEEEESGRETKGEEGDGICNEAGPSPLGGHCKLPRGHEGLHRTDTIVNSDTPGKIRCAGCKKVFASSFGELWMKFERGKIPTKGPLLSSN